MPIHVSASSLADYISCSNKVHFRVFETGEAVPTREMLMGTITHKVLEKAWQDKDVALNLADTLCKKEGIDAIGKESVNHFVHTYFDHFRFLVANDDKVEKRFKVKLYDDVFLVGVFDRVTNDIIIDWKTNAKPPKNIDNNVQFILYDWAYKLLYDRRPSGLYLAALKDGTLVKYKESKQHADVLINNIVPEFVEAVRTRTFVKTGLFNGACYRCQYKIPCLGGGKYEDVGNLQDIE